MTDVAIGASGIVPVLDLRGTVDPGTPALVPGSDEDQGRVLQALIAAAAEEDAVVTLPPGRYRISGVNLPARNVDHRARVDGSFARGDAVVVLDELVEPKSLLGIRVFFPDPWPKARHHKRRFLQSGTLATMAEKLVDDGVLHIATDHADYTEWIRELLENQDTTQTHVVPLTGDSPISLARPTTKFEGRAADEGRTVTEFVLVRAEGRR